MAFGLFGTEYSPLSSSKMAE